MKWFNFTGAALVVFSLTGSAAIAQQSANAPGLVTSRMDVAAGYNFIRTNAPPGGCDCFGLQGIFASTAYHFTDTLGVAGDFTYGHANNIGSLGQNLTLTTYMGGPRITLPGRRYVPYLQALFGAAHGSDSYFPTANSFTTSASSFALTAGGGVDIRLNHRFSIRAVQVQYLKTSLRNGTNNSQNHLDIGTGLVLKFGGHGEVPLQQSAPSRPASIELTCETNTLNIPQGEMAEIVATSASGIDDLDMEYTWSSSAGTIHGTGRRISINTGSLKPGDYKVRGRASVRSNPSRKGNCETSFHVIVAVHVPPPMATTTAPVALPPSASEKDKLFHEHVRDALFDYDSALLRPDAQTAINEAAAYLKANPEVLVQVGGYSDERGNADYNLVLSAKRANAARDALIANGVDPGRIEIISYGKNVQLCSAGNEQCWQQNRRAAFRIRQ